MSENNGKSDYISSHLEPRVELLLKKLHALVRENIFLVTSTLQRKIELQTRFNDWKEGHLKDSFFSSYFLSLEAEFQKFEQTRLTISSHDLVWSTTKSLYSWVDKKTNTSSEFFPEDNLPVFNSTQTSTETIELD